MTAHAMIDQKGDWWNMGAAMDTSQLIPQVILHQIYTMIIIVYYKRSFS